MGHADEPITEEKYRDNSAKFVSDEKRTIETTPASYLNSTCKFS
jgi:hypothetical protein